MRYWDWTHAREIARLAVPVLVTNVAGIGRFFIATYFVSQLGVSHLAVLGLAATVVEVVMALLMGLVVGTGVLTSEHGGSPEGARKCLVNALALACLIGAVLTVGFWYFQPISEFLHLPLNFHTPEPSAPEAYADLTDETEQFFRYYAIGAIPFCMAGAIRFFLLGMGKADFISASNIIGFVVCALVMFVLVFGHLGIPAMWVPGVALGISISFWAVLFLLVGYLYLRRKELKLTGEAPVRLVDWRFQWEMLRLGLPLSILAGIEVGVMAIVIFFMRRWGVDAIAAYQVVMQVTVMATMWPISAGESAAVVTGRCHSEPSLNVVRLYRSALLLTVGSALVGAVGLLLIQGRLLSAFLESAAATDLAVTMIPPICAFIVLGAFVNIAFAMLRGLKISTGPTVVMVCVFLLVDLPLMFGIYFLTDWHPSALVWATNVSLVVSAVCYHQLLVRTPRYATDHQNLAAASD